MKRPSFASVDESAHALQSEGSALKSKALAVTCSEDLSQAATLVHCRNSVS
jgi:hypothetical protein